MYDDACPQHEQVKFGGKRVRSFHRDKAIRVFGLWTLNWNFGETMLKTESRMGGLYNDEGLCL